MDQLLSNILTDDDRPAVPINRNCWIEGLSTMHCLLQNRNFNIGILYFYTWFFFFVFDLLVSSNKNVFRKAHVCKIDFIFLLNTWKRALCTNRMSVTLIWNIFFFFQHLIFSLSFLRENFKPSFFISFEWRNTFSRHTASFFMCVLFSPRHYFFFVYFFLYIVLSFEEAQTNLWLHYFSFSVLHSIMHWYEEAKKEETFLVKSLLYFDLYLGDVLIIRFFYRARAKCGKFFMRFLECDSHFLLLVSVRR